MRGDEEFYRLLEWLANRQNILAERLDVGGVRQDVYDASIRHTQLDASLVGVMVRHGHSGAIVGTRPRQSIWLPPVSEGDHAIAMLSPHWDFRDGDTRALALYVGLYYFDTRQDAVDGVGYRYEGPHPSGEDLGRHDYYHAQPISDFADGAGIDLPVQLRGQPTSTPAFPLEATTAAELLVCLLISLYGGSYVKTLAQSGVEGIGDVLDCLGCCQRSRDSDETV